MDAPRVFEEGTVTIVLGPGGCTVYAGAKEIEMFEHARAESRSGQTPLVELKFARSHEQDVDLRIEESARTARTIPWVVVSR